MRNQVHVLDVHDSKLLAFSHLPFSEFIDESMTSLIANYANLCLIMIPL
jgi:hypothetical protein